MPGGRGAGRGDALLYSDGVVTPAISVLSAFEGLKLDATWITPFAYR